MSESLTNGFPPSPVMCHLLTFTERQRASDFQQEETEFSVGDVRTRQRDAADGPDPKLVLELLVGTWRVDGPDIRGQAEYQSKKGGRLLVAYVDFSIGDSRMRVIQHITYDHEHGSLRARYMDTMGDEATYTWALEDRTIRVSLGDEHSDTYFRATLNEDNSQYVGTWHYPEGPPDATENIVYTRVKDDG